MALDPNRWTQKTTEAFNAAVESARTNSHPEVTPEHLLAAMLGQEGTVVFPVLQSSASRPPSCAAGSLEALGKLPEGLRRRRPDPRPRRP